MEEAEEEEATQTGAPGGVQHGGSQRGRTTVAWLSPEISAAGWTSTESHRRRAAVPCCGEDVPH